MVLVTSEQAKQEKENKAMKKEEQRRINESVEDFLVLKSYNTVVAVIDKEEGILYDFSRLVYGYTSTTDQHIAKFANEFDKVYDRYIWKEVK